MTYFPKPFVLETLTDYDVPKETREKIAEELSERDPDVVERVEQKAAGKEPYPLTDPNQRDVAVRLFRQSLAEVFGEVLKSNGINDDSKMQKMLDDIQKRKAQKFAECLEQRQMRITSEIEQEKNPDIQEAEEALMPRDLNRDMKPGLLIPESE